MTAEPNRGQIVDAGDARGVARVASEHIASALREAITQAGSATLALSGGNTPRAAYALLAREPGIDWSRMRIFWVDERAVPPTDERSNYRWAKETLLDPAAVPPERVHRMRGEAPDVQVAARDYEALIRQGVAPDADRVPSFDVAIMGIGDDGHTASLFPGEATIAVVDRLVSAVPASAAHEARLTITRPVIEHARRLIFLVEGADKVPALRRVLADEGDVRHTPARLTRTCRGALEWIVDSAAAAAGR
ncbi:MAG: 6-phosphogluconolactonase [Polyangiaceae bacterium]|jgi:6-phosphogluconolactonase